MNSERSSDIPRIDEARSAYSDLVRRLRLYHVFDVFDVIHEVQAFHQFGMKPKRIRGVPKVIGKKSRKPFGGFPFPWELELLAREAVLHSGYLAHRSVYEWDEISHLTSLVRHIGNCLTPEYEALGTNVFREMHRIMARQFPWQKGVTHKEYSRYWKLFGQSELEGYIEREFGVCATEFFISHFALSSMCLGSVKIDLPINISSLSIDRNCLELLIKKSSVNIVNLRAEIRSKFTFDANFEYLYNPLISSPFVFSPEVGARLFCPLSFRYVNRFCSGLYYDFCGLDGFDQRLGKGFEGYVGSVLGAALGARAEMWSERRVRAPGGDFDTIDWLVRDGESYLFIECKSKRFRFGAKYNIHSSDELNSDLDVISSEMAKQYINLSKFIDGRYQFESPKEKSIFPIMLSIEEWPVMYFRQSHDIDKMVRRKIRDRGVDPSIYDKYPLTYCDIDVFEDLIVSISSSGSEGVLKKKIDSDERHDYLSSYLKANFSKSLSSNKSVWNDQWHGVLDNFIDRNV